MSTIVVTHKYTTGVRSRPSSLGPNYHLLQVLLITRAGVGFGLSGTFTQYTLFMEWLPYRSRGTWLVLFQAW